MDPTAIDSIAEGIAGVESGGNYGALGPPTKSGDRAYGKYQIMGNNIPGWTAEALGQSMSPQDFLNNPDAQEKTAKHQLNKYYDQYGNAKDVASVWHSGVPYDQAAAEGRADALGTKTTDYADRVAGGAGAAPTTPAEPAAPDVKVKLPDNTVINLGPNPTPELRAQVKEKILAKFPDLRTPGTYTTTTTPTSATTPPAPTDFRAQSVEDLGKELNRSAGRDETHWIGKYAAALGKPGVDALIDLYDVVKKQPLGGGSPGALALTGDWRDALKSLHALAVPAEAAGNVALQAALDAGADPTSAATLATAVGLVAGAATPLPGGGAGPASEMPFQGTAALRAKAAEATSAATAAAEKAAATRAAGEAATTSTAQQAEAATAAAKAAGEKVAPSPEAAARATEALTPAGVTTEQGGQAAVAGLEQQLADIKDPTQGIYKAVEENAANASKSVDPAQYKGIYDQLSAIEQELGPTLTGQAKDVIANLKSKIDAGQKLTFADLAPYKTQLDTLFPGKMPLGATPRTAALYNFKWDVRNLMSSMLDGTDKEWFDVANTMWRDKVIPTQKLLEVVRKSSPVEVVERLFGNGTSDKQAAMARRVFGTLGDTASGEAVRQSVFARMLSKAKAGDSLDPEQLLNQYDGLNENFRNAVDNPGSKAFFDVLRSELGAAKSTGEAATAAEKTAAVTAKTSARATKLAEREAAKAGATAKAATQAATAPNRLARFTAKGLEIGGIEAAATALGHPGYGAFALGRFLLPADALASFLANSKTANLLARALKTPANSAVVPTIIQQLRNAGVLKTEETPQ